MFEASYPFRHACELYNVLQSLSNSKPVLFLYSDRGPDHCLTYVSVQLSLVCLFLNLDLDFLCAGQTAPYHSWCNPVERVMAVLNLGLQCVGLAREKMPEEYEKEVAKCNNLTQLRKIAKRNDQFVRAVGDSLSPVKSLLCDIFSCLQLQEKPIQAYESATPQEISEFWTGIMAIDETLEEDGRYVKANIHEHKKIPEFFQHCCQTGHYTFDVLKCGKDTCKLCKPVRLPRGDFDAIKHLPFPVPGDDGHYCPFAEVLGMETSEEHRPSLKKASKAKAKSLPFYVCQCSTCEERSANIAVRRV